MCPPGIMGCGRSKTKKDDAVCKADQDNNDIYEKSSSHSHGNSVSPMNGSNMLSPNSSGNGNSHLQTNGDVSSADENDGGGSKSGAQTGQLQQNAKITASQVEFFRMLDEKIEKGNDMESDIAET